jgi:nucleotide-binding universal stress UspA family protein
MKMIIVGVDGNPPAEEAAAKAAALAHATGAALHVVCAFGREQVAEVEAGDGALRISVSAESAAIATEVAARVTLDPERTTSGAVHGRPADALLAEAHRLDADLIVVGNKRVQSVARALGTIASAVAHRAPCDLYVARTH